MNERPDGLYPSRLQPALDQLKTYAEMLPQREWDLDDIARAASIGTMDAQVVALVNMRWRAAINGERGMLNVIDHALGIYTFAMPDGRLLTR